MNTRNRSPKEQILIDTTQERWRRKNPIRLSDLAAGFLFAIVGILWVAGSPAKAHASDLPAYFYLPDEMPATALKGTINPQSDVFKNVRVNLDPNRCDNFSYNPLGQLLYKQCGTRTYSYTYNGFGQASVRIGTAPPLPSFKINKVNIGNVSIGGTIVRSLGMPPKYQYQLNGLSVTANGNHGTATSAIVNGSAPLVAVKTGRQGLSLRFKARLDDGTILTANMIDAGASADGKSQSLSLGSASLTGPLAGAAFGISSGVKFKGTSNGSATLTNEGRPLEFTAAWVSGTKGTVTFTGPENLVTFTAVIRRTGSGAYLLAGKGVTALIRADGSGHFDVGYGKVLFGTGAMTMGSLADKDARYRLDDLDPADDLATGATSLDPSGGTTPTHSLSHRDAQDWYKIALEWGTWYSFLLSSASDKASLEVYDENLALITWVGGQGGDFLCSKTGTYYLRASIPSSFALSLTYTIQWAEASPPISEATALSPSSGGALADRSLIGGSHDWCRIDLTAGGLGYAFAVTGAPQDGLSNVELNIYDANLALVNAPDRVPSGQLLAGIETGTYYLDFHNLSPSAETFSVYWNEVSALAPITSFAASVGASIAVDGTTAVIGGGNPRVLVRSGTTWTTQQALSGTGPVAISGDTILVGPSVFVRANGIWALQQTLPVTGTIIAVALDGDTAVIGRSIYTRSGNTWALQQTLTESVASAAIFGDTVLVGNPVRYNVGSFGRTDFRGRAYVFARSAGTWTLQQELVAPADISNSFFGEAVAIDGETAIIGAPGLGQNTGNPLGAAYLFGFSSGAWTALQKLKASDSNSPFARFGSSVALDGGTALVGADAARSAYSFTRWGGFWAQQFKFTSGGSKVALSPEASLVLDTGGTVFDYGAVGQ